LTSPWDTQHSVSNPQTARKVPTTPPFWAEAALPHSLAPIPTRAFPDHGLDTLSPLFLGTSSPALAAAREAVGRYVSCSLLSVGIGLPRYPDQALSLAAGTCGWHRKGTAAPVGGGGGGRGWGCGW